MAESFCDRMSAFEQLAASIYFERKLLQTLGDRFFHHPLKKNQLFKRHNRTLNGITRFFFFFRRSHFLSVDYGERLMVGNPSERINAKNIINRLAPSGINEI